MSALPSSRKTHSERHKQILKQLLKEPANKVCADCKTATHPRWASWNLGCFICIRCSGIHRLMGTHISRVKSVDLDAWTDEQVELMVKWGNAKCNAFWEAKLPDSYIPDGLKIENFIRTKYDMKKWALSTHVPDPLTVKVGASVSSTEAPVQKAAHRVDAGNGGRVPQKHAAGPARMTSQSQRSSPAVSLLEDDFGAFTSSPLPSPVPAMLNTTNTSAPVVARAASTSPAPITGRVVSERRDLKKSILSLYSLASSPLAGYHNTNASAGAINTYPGSTNSYGGASNMYAGAPNSFTGLPHLNGKATTTKPAGDVSSMTESLLSLNFGQSATPEPTTESRLVPKWSNEWNDSSLSVNNWNMANSSSSIGSPLGNTYMGSMSLSNYTTRPKNGLDDDLYKNVWS